MWDPLCIFATVKASNFKFGTQLGFGTGLPKNNVLDQNLRESGPREHPKKIWDPVRIFATVEASNFKCGTQIGFGTILPNTTFKTKLAGVWAKGASEKNVGPPTYFCNR